MQYKKSTKKSVKNKKIFLIVAVVSLFLVLASVGYYIVKNRNSAQTNNEEVAKTTSTLPSAQEDYTSNSDRQVADKVNKGEAVVADNGGALTETPDQSQWSFSKNGEITLYGPAKNSTVKPGDLVIGESSLSSVNYRIIDSVSGVISEGTLQVVKGKFSGTLNFTTTASEGRLDLYASKEDGAEYANVEIPILFQ